MILESEFFEDQNNDLDIVKTMKKVQCKVLQEGYKVTLMNFYLCSCDPEQKKPICEECAVVCHAGHKIGTRFYEKQVCSCGKKNHILNSTANKCHP